MQDPTLLTIKILHCLAATVRGASHVVRHLLYGASTLTSLLPLAHRPEGLPDVMSAAAEYFCNFSPTSVPTPVEIVVLSFL